ALVAVRLKSVIARRFKRTILTSVHQGMQRTFCSAQKVLDHDTSTRVAKAALIDHLIDGGSSRHTISGNDYSLSQSKAVCFDHHWKFQLFAVMQRFATVGKRPGLGCRD